MKPSPDHFAKAPAPGSASRGNPKKAAPKKTEKWILRLYVAGQTPKSVAAFATLKRICEEHLAGRYRIEVVDLAENPQLANHDQIVALPTLVRKLPEPIKRIIGDLADIERVMVGIELYPTANL